MNALIANQYLADWAYRNESHHGHSQRHLALNLLRRNSR
jgi:hypothetical protein